MTLQEIIKGNKLIAIFNGAKENDYTVTLQKDTFPDRAAYHYLDELLYHASWDWLMPVVNKIRSLYNVDVDVPFDTVDVIAEGCIEANIIQVYTGVVEFIKWYNQNKVITAKPCPNCNETEQPCACMRNICYKCGKPVGNITFTVCDDCWDVLYPRK